MPSGVYVRTECGRKLKPETIEKCRQSHLGKHPKPETIEKIRKSNIGKQSGDKHPMYGVKGKDHYNFGRIHSESSKLKTSESMKGKFSGSKNPMFGKRGENSPSWQGGKSFEPYCPKFNFKKREEVRNIFHRKCIICGKPEHENIVIKGKRKGQVIRLTVHHVDYNKLQGCAGHEWRLAPLCMICHTKTGHNREFWEKKICEMIEEFERK